MTAEVDELIQQAEQDRLWGCIQIDFQDGNVVLIRKTETIKPTPAEGTTDANAERKSIQRAR
ncbi:MAG TPA: hypothetical protein VEJ46_04845 [Candidatus Acidoferrum sp.]|nr:hypothetical protein [Candidatus Acidoferrum sp.]